MKDVNIDVQSDLIQTQDQSVETDCAITLKRESLGGCNLWYIVLIR